MAKSYYLDNAFLNAALRGTAYAAPPAVYCALFTVTPGPSGGGTEVNGNGYARTAVTFSAPTNGSMTNSADCTFPQATGGGWGTIAYFGIFDDPNAGNLLYYGSLTSSKTINSGDQLKFASGAITTTES